MLHLNGRILPLTRPRVVYSFLAIVEVELLATRAKIVRNRYLQRNSNRRCSQYENRTTRQSTRACVGMGDTPAATLHRSAKLAGVRTSTGVD